MRKVRNRRRTGTPADTEFAGPSRLPPSLWSNLISFRFLARGVHSRFRRDPGRRPSFLEQVKRPVDLAAAKQLYDVAMNRCALLVIDLQVGAFDANVVPALHRGDDILERASMLIGAARSAGIPVVFSQHCESAGRPLARGTAGWAIHPSVSPEPSDTVVLKHESSAFQGTNLKEVLEQLDIDTVVACGIQSEFCVANTCTSALDLGLKVHVAGDAHSTVSTDDADASLIIERQNSQLAGMGAKVQSSAALVTLLVGPDGLDRRSR